jgi:hypothetical protein
LLGLSVCFATARNRGAQHLKIINTEIFLYSDDADTKKVLTFAVGKEGAERASAKTHRDKTIINPLYLK